MLVLLILIIIFMKKNLQSLKLLSFLVLLGLVSSNTLMAQTDVTATHLSNAGFDNTCNYLFDAVAANLGTSNNDGSTVQTVTDWTGEYSGWTAGSSFEYGYAGTLNDPGPIPATASDGSTTGSGNGALGVCAAWAGSVSYYQDVTLPAGTYSLSYNVYNSHPATAGTSIAGWVPSSGPSALSAITSFTQNTWTADVVNFAVTAETTGKLQIGILSVNLGSADNGRFFFDDIQLMYTPVVLSNNDTLSALTSDVGTFDPVFDPEVTTYNLVVPGGTTTVNLSATAEDAAATVLGDGVIDLTGGNVTVSILVTAENGDTQTYTVNVISDATLSALTTDVGTLDPVFDAAVTTYFLEVPEGTTTVNLSATANAAAASVVGDGAIDISGGNETASIVVTADQGNAITYTVHIAAEGCFTPLFTDRDNLVPDSSCSDLSGFGGWGHKSVVYGADAYCGFGGVMFEATTNGWPDGAAMDITDIAWVANSAYRVRFMYKTMDGSLGLLANQTDPNFSMPLPDTEDEWVEIDTVFQVGASPGTSFFTINNVDAGADGLTAFIDNYELYEVANDGTLSTLTTSLGTLTPAFSSDVTDYAITVPSGTSSVTVTAATNDATATLVGDGAISLTNGEGIAEIVITPESGIPTTYTITFSSSLSSDASLSAIDIEGAHLISPAFDPATLEYDVTVASGTDTVILAATANHAAASITSIDDTVDVQSGSEVATIVVEAEDGTEQTYTVNIDYEATDCFVPLFSDRSNIITDSLLNDFDNFGGWGSRSIYTGPDAYCGISSGLITGGSLDFVLAGLISANTTYRVRAMVNATSTNAQIGMKHWDNTQGDITTQATVVDDWAPIDFVFTTGDALGVDPRLFFNNADGSYIDNWEMYELYDDATLSDLQVGGTSITGFKADSLVYDVELASGTTEVPDVTPVTTDNNAAFEIDTAATLSDTTVVVVTAEDGTTTETYKVAFTVVTLSDDATLSDLQVEGTSIAGFKADSLVYDVELASGTTEVPDVTPVTTDNNAAFEIDTAATLSDTTIIVVTAEDGTTTETYKVAFTVAALSDDATLSDLQVDGTTVTDFDAATLSYDVELAAGTTTVPTVTATTTDDDATAVVTAATELDGATTVLVTAEDGTMQTYNINFSVHIISVDEIAESSIAIYPTVSNGDFTVITENETSAIKVYNLNGELVLEQRGNSYEQTLSLSGTGMYLVKVESGNSTRTFKLFVTN